MSLRPEGSSPSHARPGQIPAGPGRRLRLRKAPGKAALLLLVLLACTGSGIPAALALESDRQQPLELDAEGSEGSLGDGISLFRGQVEIRQGSLHILADEAEVLKSEGRVTRVTFKGQPAQLEQEIEEQGLVQAEANTITYEVSAGKVQLAGNADVNHPQYRISGELLTYDLDTQHFEGSGGATEDGRISIRLEPEVAGELQDQPATETAAPAEVPAEPDSPDAGDS